MSGRVGKRGGERKRTASNLSSLYNRPPNPALLHPPHWGERVADVLSASAICFSSSSTVRLFNCIFSSRPLVASPLPLSIPSLPRACLSGLVPVCLFADDSTWSRCDSQQLLLCSITPSCPPPLPPLPYLSPPSLQCLLCYLSTYLFVLCDSVTRL